jgi:hypothetical protein
MHNLNMTFGPSSLRRRQPRHRRLRRVVAAASAMSLVTLVVQAATADRFLLNNYFPQGIPGYGQELGVTVLSRARPQYDPLGVRSGDFIIRPELDESLGYNSNLLGQSNGQGSFVVDTAGSLRFNSDWNRNSLGGEITFDDRRTPSVPKENRTDWTATLGGTYEIGRDVLTVAGSHLSLHQDPTDIGAQQFSQTGTFFTAPVPFTLDDVRVSYATNFGAFGVTPNVEYTRLRFDNLKLFGLNGAVVPPETNGLVLGVPVNQRYRDRDLFEAGVTGRYEFAPLRNAVLVLRDTNTNYVSSQRDQFGANRSSNSIEVLGGLDYVASAVWRYRALIGYEVREFHNAAYKTHAAPVVEGNVIWQPSGLDTITLKAARSIEDAADENVSGYDYSTARLSIDHEYARNILLSAYVGLQRADYLQVNASETLYGGGVGATWLLDRNVHLAATYDVTQRQGSASFGANYLQNVALLQLRLGL